MEYKSKWHIHSAWILYYSFSISFLYNYWCHAIHAHIQWHEHLLCRKNCRTSSSYVYKTVSSLTNYEETSVHIILHLTYFNPHSIHRMDVDISTTNLHAEKRALSATEEDELCNICMDKVVRCEIINALQCNHIYHHQCIIDWIRMNLKCPTCRDTISLTTCFKLN